MLGSAVSEVIAHYHIVLFQHDILQEGSGQGAAPGFDWDKTEHLVFF